MISLTENGQSSVVLNRSADVIGKLLLSNFAYSLKIIYPKFHIVIQLAIYSDSIKPLDSKFWSEM